MKPFLHVSHQSRLPRRLLTRPPTFNVHHTSRSHLWRRGDHPGHFGAVRHRGLEVATPAFTPYIVLLPLAVLPGLYLVQSRGAAGIGKWFGSITLLWFAVLAAMDLVYIVQAPAMVALYERLVIMLMLNERS